MIFDEIKELFQGLPNWEALTEAWDQFTQPASEGGFDGWPFNDDGDGRSPFQEIQNNVRLLTALLREVVTAVEYAASQAEDLDGAGKLELAVSFLQPIIKTRLTGWARPARMLLKPILRHAITAVVQWLNVTFNSVEEGRTFLHEASGAVKEEAPE